MQCAQIKKMDGIQTFNFCSSPATHRPTEVRVKKNFGGDDV